VKLVLDPADTRCTCSQSGSKDNSSTGSLASAVCRVARDNSSRSGSGCDYSAEDSASCAIASDNNCRATSLADAIGQRPSHSVGREEGKTTQEVLVRLHVDVDVDDCFWCLVGFVGFGFRWP
jgi:hypothetical protein